MDHNWLKSLMWEGNEEDPDAWFEVYKKIDSTAKRLLESESEQIENAIDVGIGNLDDSDFRIRNFAAMMLGLLGERAHRAVPALLAHLAERNRYASSAIKKALVQIGPIGIPDIVQVMNSNPNARVRARCAAILSGKTAASAFPDLKILAFEDPNATVRYRATAALRAIKGRENPEALEALLVNAKKDEKGAYQWGGEIGTYLYDLWKCLVSKDEEVRQQTFDLVKRFQLHKHESIAKSWVTDIRGGQPKWLVGDDADLIERRLAAFGLLDEHLHFHTEFLNECTRHHSIAVQQMANDLILRLK